ncbi:hypothetical protein EDC04DRAFT_1331093 [Pisolithus marmoratus]|nr:hypothetical protein EDC04DRAFT_1331093 [Pisolithus marmoratus]
MAWQSDDLKKCIFKAFFLFLLSLAFPPVGSHSLHHHPCSSRLISLSFYISRSLSLYSSFICSSSAGHISIYFFNFFITIMKCKEDFGLDGDGEPLCIVCSLHTYEQCSTISVFRM